MSNYGRITGLVSGLDTENLIKQMMQAEKLKIDRVKEKQQLDVWRQERYRDVSSMLIGLKSEFMDILKSESNLKSPKTFNVFTPSVKLNGKDSEKISVNVHGTLPQDFEINSVQRLASNHKLTSNKRAKEMLSGEITPDKLSEFNVAIGSDKLNLKFNIDGVERTLTLTAQQYTTVDDIAAELTVKFKEVFGENIGNVSTEGNRLKFNFDGHNVRFAGGDNELALPLGFPQDASNVLSKNTTLKDMGITSSVHNYFVDSTELDAAALAKINALDEAQFKIKFKYGDDEKEIAIEKKEYKNAGELATAINEKLAEQFPAQEVSVSIKNNKLEFLAKDKQITFVNDDATGLSKELGIAGSTGNPTEDSGMVNLSVNGRKIAVKETDTLAQFMSKVSLSGAGVKMTFDEFNGKFQLIAENTGFVHRIKFDDDATNAIFEKFGLNREDAVSEGGEDALYTLNGQTMSSFSNTVNKNGISLTLNQLHDAAEGSIKVNYTKNTDDVVKKVKSFVEKYNEMYDKLLKATKEQREYKYKPLTKEQKKEMEKEDIEKWEEKAKSGLLKNDLYVEKVLRDLRSAFLHNVGESGLSAQDLGLKLTSNYREVGKIVFDEVKFRTTLEKNPTAVVNVFTEVSDIPYTDKSPERANKRFRAGGLMQRISDVIDDATRTTSIGNKKGYFVEKAGIKGSASESLNELSKNIKRYDRKIEEMFELMYKKEERLYRQFARLESMLQKANSQSMQFMNMMGNNNNR